MITGEKKWIEKELKGIKMKKDFIKQIVKVGEFSETGKKLDGFYDKKRLKENEWALCRFVTNA